jgi:signal transduction histidine kinase
MIGESALLRHLRIGAIATGLASIVFGLLSIGDMVKQSGSLAPPFAVASIVLFSGLPILMAALARWGSVSAVRWVARGHTIATALIIVLWTQFQLHGPLPDNSAPWILNTVGVVAGSAVIAWHARIVWVYLILVAVSGAELRYVGLGTAAPVIALEDGLSILEFTVVMATLLVVALRAGSAQDVEMAIAVRNARGAAESLSHTRQRSRFAAFVHDDVITTLIVASLASRRMPAIELSAAKAMLRLDGFLDAPASELPLDMELLQTEVRAAVTDIVDGVSFEGSFSKFHKELPGEVALAITGALGEAARNSVRHAGSVSVRREVKMSATANHLVVEFVDDGAGFDPTRVANNRFGVRTSIRARVTESGGDATVSSTPGAGTVVRIEWPRSVL